MKQALSEALAYWEKTWTALSNDERLKPVGRAARLVERLLPGKCENRVHGRPFSPNAIDVPDTCPDCIDGWVWDEGIVEAVAKAIHDYWNRGSEKFEPRTAESRGQLEEARAVLSALAQLVEKGET